jgi:hypothetical protein
MPANPGEGALSCPTEEENDAFQPILTNVAGTPDIAPFDSLADSDDQVLQDSILHQMPFRSALVLGTSYSAALEPLTGQGSLRSDEAGPGLPKVSRPNPFHTRLRPTAMQNRKSVINRYWSAVYGSA